jgi:hypothetical protein
MNNDTAASAATFLVAGLALILMLLWASTAAPAASICLSKKDARQLWPKQHIYWYSKHHCWSNRRGPPRNLKMDPIVNLMAKEARAKEPEDKCCWPVLPRDTLGNIIEPLRSFIDRWQDQPWIGRIIGK